MASIWGGLARAATQGATGYLAGDQQRRQRDEEQRRYETQQLVLQAARQQQSAREADATDRQKAQDALNGILTGSAPADPMALSGAMGGVAMPPRYEQVTPTRYVDETRTPEARATRTMQAQQEAASAAAERAERVRLFMQQQTEASAERRAAAANATTLQAAGIRANAASGNASADKAGKASGDLANQYAHTYPVESADKFASNAANALLGVQLARQGNREGHLMAITGFLRQTHPDAVVRTNDKGMLEEVQGVPANVAMSVRRMFGQGGLLTPDALTEIEHATHTLIAGQRATLAPVQAFYGGLARTRGADSSSVVRDPFQGLDAGAGNAKPPATPLQAKWDLAASHLRAQGKDPDKVIGARP